MSSRATGIPEKRLGCLSKKELLEEVRKIFPNATVLPNLEMTEPQPIQTNERNHNEQRTTK